jgi:hypothetical protein
VEFVNGTGTTVDMEHELDVFIEKIKKLKERSIYVPCQSYPDDFHGKYPALVYRNDSVGPKQDCKVLAKIGRKIPDSNSSLYWNAVSKDGQSFVAHLNSSYYVLYSGNYDFESMKAFAREWTLSPFGSWKLSEGISSCRRFGFVVAPDQSNSVSTNYRNILKRRTGTWVVKEISERKWLKQGVSQRQSKNPLFVALNKEKSLFGVFQIDRNFESLLHRIEKGKLESEMNINLGGLFPELANRWRPGNKFDQIDLAPSRSGRFLIFGCVGWILIIGSYVCCREDPNNSGHGIL